MTKSTSDLKLFDTQLKDTIAPLLEQHGFARVARARLWVRPSATGKDVCHLVWFQIGEPASTLGGRYTGEVAVYYPRYDRFANGRDLLGPVINACHFDMRRRFGLFLTKPEDHWWPYTGGVVPLTKQLAAVTKLLIERGLPWLAEADSPANEATYNTGKMPEPDRLRREAFLRSQAAKKSS